MHALLQDVPKMLSIVPSNVVPPSVVFIKQNSLSIAKYLKKEREKKPEYTLVKIRGETD